MRYATSLAVVVTALTLVGAANAATQSSQPAKTASKAAEPAKAAPAAKVTGTLQKYDASTNTVVVKVGKKEESFVLGPGAELRLGAQTLAAADLSQHVGQQVAVLTTGCRAAPRRAAGWSWPSTRQSRPSR